MALSLLDILSILGLLPFSGITRIVPFSRLTSVHSRRLVSPILTPVSFSSWRRGVNFLEQPAMSWSISFSVGMKGSFRATLYLGGSHFRSCILRKHVYVSAALTLRLSHHFCARAYGFNQQHARQAILQRVPEDGSCRCPRRSRRRQLCLCGFKSRHVLRKKR